MAKAPCIPDELPLADLDWRKLLPLVGRANAALARYDGMLQTLPDAGVLLSPITVNEAVLSSRIEGTQATLDEVLEFDAGIAAPENRRGDIEEVSNYRIAVQIPLLARMKYRSEERQIEAYTRLVAAKNLLLSVLDDQRKLLEAREISIVRIENLGSIREIERRKIENELTLLQKDAELEGLRRSVEIEELQVRLAEAQRRRAEINNPPVPPLKKTVAQEIEEALVELREVDDLFNQRRDELIKAAGGVANLTEDERQTLERLEILRRTHVEKLHEDLL